MNLKDLPILELMYIVPDDIKVIIGVLFAFLVGLAVWRIIVG